MKTINSADNNTYRLSQQLLMKKYRDLHSKFLVEGQKMVAEAAAAGCAELVIAVEGYNGKIDFPGTETVFMKGKLFSKIAQTKTSQGIAAVVRKKEYAPGEFETLIRGKGNIIILDGLQDPGNIGTIIRTADAAGYAGVITVKGTADVYSPKVVRAAAGSVIRIPLHQVGDPAEAVAEANRAGKKIVGTSLDADIMYYDADLTEDIALVIGNEGSGMSETFREMSQMNIKIPMSGEIDSLNAAVAAGILMYQSFRKG